MTRKNKDRNVNPSDLQRSATARVAKMIALHCVRNTFIENIHAGKTPSSKTGDYSDVKVITPFGEIPWTEVSRISDEEMKRFNKEVVNKLFTFLFYLSNQDLPITPEAFYLPSDWDDPETDSSIASVFEAESR